MSLKGMKIQVVVADKRDYIIKYQTFVPVSLGDIDAILRYIVDGMEFGDVRLTRWDAKTGERV